MLALHQPAGAAGRGPAARAAHGAEASGAWAAAGAQPAGGAGFEQAAGAGVRLPSRSPRAPHGGRAQAEARQTARRGTARARPGAVRARLAPRCLGRGTPRGGAARPLPGPRPGLGAAVRAGRVIGAAGRRRGRKRRGRRRRHSRCTVGTPAGARRPAMGRRRAAAVPHPRHAGTPHSRPPLHRRAIAGASWRTRCRSPTGSLPCSYTTPRPSRSTIWSSSRRSGGERDRGDRKRGRGPRPLLTAAITVAPGPPQLQGAAGARAAAVGRAGVGRGGRARHVRR
jgi:hypothetical protein